MTTPTPLVPGDHVALIATSGPVPQEHISPSIKAVESYGFNVETGPSITQSKRYLAGSDSTRADDINAMFARADICGIFVIRGGYGAGRLPELLDLEMIRRNPKFFAGYSDVTALHIILNQFCGFITFHTPMASTELYRGVDPYTQDMFRRVMSGNYRGGIMNPAGQEIKTLRTGRCRGRLTGGNLTTLVASLGTPYEIDTTGKILLLEDIGEAPYRVDRMLTQLRQSAKIKAAAGIILGDFTDCGDKSELIEIFDELLPSDKPVIYNLALGHCMPTMSLALGAEYYMDAESGVLVCEG